MNKIVAYVKGHPYTIGALVIGGGVAFFVIRGAMRNSGGTTVVASSSGPSADQQLAAMQIQAQQGVQSAAISADLQKAAIESDLDKYVANIQGQAALAQVDAQKSVSLADIGAQTSMFTIQNQTAIHTADLAAQTDQLQINQSAALQQAQIAANQNTMTQVITALTPQPDASTQAAKALDTKAQSYLNNNPDVASSTWLAQLPDSVVGDRDNNGVINSLDRAIYHYSNYGQAEGRAF